MKTTFFTFFIILAVLAQTSIAQKQVSQVDYYVSVNGDDANPGSIDKPFRTITKAKNTVRLLLKDDTHSNITVFLRGGNYFIENTICFDERDGSENVRIKYSGYKKEKAIIFGGVEVKEWAKWKDNVYRAKLPEKLQSNRFYRLFDNSRSAVLARYPNYGSGFGNGLKRINNTTVKVPEEWKNYDFSNAQVYGWIGHDWFSELRAVENFDKDSLRLTVDPGSGIFNGLNERIFIQGVPELLDQENEWCIKNDSVYYYPSDKSNINKRMIVAPLVSRVMEIKGSSDNN